MEQKNFILAVVLSLGFILLWSVFVVPKFAPPQAPVSATSPVSAGGSADPAMMSATGESSATPTAPSATVVLQNADNTVTLDPRGGSVQKWILDTKLQTLDVVEHAEGLPLASFPNTLFKISTHGDTAVMEATLPNGVHVTKTLTLAATGWGPGLGTVTTEQKENASQIRALTMGPLTAHVVKEGDHPEFGRWVGIDNRYFLVAFIPTSAHTTAITSIGKKEFTRVQLVEDTHVPGHGTTMLSYELYVGPKGYTALKTYNRSLEASVNFGTFSAVGKLILRALYRLKAWTGNYGVSIIILTLILQILLLPLTLKSFKAAQSMKKLQPKLARLKEMYGGDPKRMNVETMNLYKTSGTNPFGGCLPMVVQLPIFWALFTTLRNAYELRGSPFVGWIHDLSIHDPLYILPVVMGGGMFLQQRMTGSTADPTQRQMMYIMPVMFTVMFANFPAGLVLYWLTNSLATITFQWIYLRYTTGTAERPEIVKH
jgi:YidC/Oxa1 family membrane protein insertase